MTAEVFNSFGSRYGYPIYVFSDGTYASNRMSGKQVIFTVEGPITTNQPTQRRLPENKKSYPAPSKQSPQKSSGFWDIVAQTTNALYRKVFPKTTPEFTDYEEVRQPVRQTTSPQARRNDGRRGTFIHRGKDWEVTAEGVTEVNTCHAKDGDKEVYVAHYRFCP